MLYGVCLSNLFCFTLLVFFTFVGQVSFLWPVLRHSEHRCGALYFMAACFAIPVWEGLVCNQVKRCKSRLRTEILRTGGTLALESSNSTSPPTHAL